MKDILEDLRNLHKQATTERSHYYVGKCCLRAIAEIEELRRAVRAVAPESSANEITVRKAISFEAAERIYG